MATQVTCSACQHRFSTDSAGGQVKCPQCGGAVAVAASLSEDDLLAELLGDELGLDSGGPSDADDALELSPIGDRPGESWCPQCGSPMDAGAVLCVDCGFNLNSGAVTETALETGNDLGATAESGSKKDSSAGKRPSKGESSDNPKGKSKGKDKGKAAGTSGQGGQGMSPRSKLLIAGGAGAVLLIVAVVGLIASLWGEAPPPAAAKNPARPGKPPGARPPGKTTRAKTNNTTTNSAKTNGRGKTAAKPPPVKRTAGRKIDTEGLAGSYDVQISGTWIDAEGWKHEARFSSFDRPLVVTQNGDQWTVKFFSLPWQNAADQLHSIQLEVPLHQADPRLATLGGFSQAKDVKLSLRLAGKSWQIRADGYPRGKPPRGRSVSYDPAKGPPRIAIQAGQQVRLLTEYTGGVAKHRAVVVETPGEPGFQRLQVAVSQPAQVPPPGVLVKNLMPGELKRLVGHTGSIRCLEAAPRGEFLLTCDDDGRLLRWNLAANTATPVAWPGGHQGPGLIRLLPDGAHVVSAAGEGQLARLQVWRLDAAPGNPSPAFDTASLPLPPGVDAPSRYRLDWNLWFEELALSDDGRRALTVSEYGRKVATVWDVPTGKAVMHQDRGDAALWHLAALSGQGNVALVGGNVWAVEGTGGVLAAVSSQQRGFTECFAFAPTGGVVAMGMADGSIEIWNAATSRIVSKCTGHRQPAAAVAFSADGSRLLSCSMDGTTRLWNVGAGRELRRYRRPQPVPSGGPPRRPAANKTAVMQVAFVGDRAAASTTPDGKVHLWDLESGDARTLAVPIIEEVAEVKDSDAVRRLATSPDGKYYVAESAEKIDGGTLAVWEVGRERPLRGFPDPGSSSRGLTASGLEWIQFTPDGKFFVTGFARQLWMWSLRGTKPISETAEKNASYGPGYFTPDGKLLVVGGDVVRVLHGRTLRTLESVSEAQQVRGMSPDGKRIVAAGRSGETLVYDLEEKRIVARTAAIKNAALAAGGRFLLGVAEGGGAVVSANDGKVLKTFTPVQIEPGEQLGEVRSLALAPGGRYVVMAVGQSGRGGRGTSVRLFESASGKQLGVLAAVPLEAESLVFLPDGHSIELGAAKADAPHYVLRWPDAETMLRHFQSLGQ